MKYIAGLIVLAAVLQPYFVWGDAAAAAASNGKGGAAAAATSGGNGGAAAAASGGNGGAAAAAASSSTPSSRSPAPKPRPPTPAPPRANVRCNCNQKWEPVCGTDGRTYSNECILRCISTINVSNGLPAIGVKRRGECPRNPCNCSKVLKPVCGSDNNSYANECLLRCENSRRKLIGLPPIKITYTGACRSNICICSDVIIPVCGTDSRTYRNVCVLQCTSRINQLQGKPPVFWQSAGACKQESCVCPAVSEPLCGSDARTYKNRCALACQNRRLDQLGKAPVRIAYKGECIKKCTCPTVYDPVCASNGVTFLNTCTLACRNKRRVANGLKPLKIDYWGVCTCKCKLIYDPVCGSDELTYANQCKFNCENKRRADLGLRQLTWNWGRCSCDCSFCPRTYAPVCGNDGRSYWNKCWLVCNRNCNSDIGRPLYVLYKGPC